MSDIIDISKIKEFTGADDKTVALYISIYIDQCEDDIQQIDKFIHNQDLNEVIRIAHNLKSKSKYLGLDHLASIGEKIENIGLFNTNKMDTIKELSASFKEEFETIKSNLIATKNKLEG